MQKPSAYAVLAALLLASPALGADEIHWTMTGLTSVTFDWRGPNSTISYGLTSAYGLTATGSTPSPLPFSSAGPFWESKLSGLLPNTLYHYSISGGEDHVFHTIPAGPSYFTVYVEGDIGDTAAYSRVGPVQSLIAADEPAFVLVIGDLTYADQSGQGAVDRHFNNVMKWSQDAADMAIWGNHEWGRTNDTDDMRNYKGRFDFPNAHTSPGVPTADCCGEDWYWFDYGQIRFIAYPEPYTGTWSDWYPQAAALMDSAQANPAIQFIVTFGHRGAYSSGYHVSNANLAGYLDALGTAHSKYVLNLNGHSHNYERSYPQKGVTHVTVGIGGANLETVSGSCPYAGGCPPPSWSAFRAYHHGTLRLRFTPTSIHGDAVCGPAGDTGANYNDITCTLGSIFDSFVIGTDPPLPVAPIAEPARLAIESIFPNPAESRTTVVYSLDHRTPARLELFDVAGRVVWERDLGSPGPGRHEFHLGNSIGPSPGMYSLRLIQDGRSVSSMVMFVR